MQFVTKTSSLIDLHVMYKNVEIVNTSNTKFLRLTLESTFSWKNHIDTSVSKLSQPVLQSAIKVITIYNPPAGYMIHQMLFEHVAPSANSVKESLPKGPQVYLKPCTEDVH
jgi:hypothetical protein